MDHGNFHNWVSPKAEGMSPQPNTLFIYKTKGWISMLEYLLIIWERLPSLPKVSYKRCFKIVIKIKIFLIPGIYII